MPELSDHGPKLVEAPLRSSFAPYASTPHHAFTTHPVSIAFSIASDAVLRLTPLNELAPVPRERSDFRARGAARSLSCAWASGAARTGPAPRRIHGRRTVWCPTQRGRKQAADKNAVRPVQVQREDKTMRAVTLTGSIAAVFTAVALGTSPGHAQQPEEVKIVFEHAIPNIPGKSLIAQVVTYAPGGKSSSHRHAPSAFIYARVLSGAIRSQVDDQPVKVYRVGESFTRCRARITE